MRNNNTVSRLQVYWLADVLALWYFIHCVVLHRRYNVFVEEGEKVSLEKNREYPLTQIINEIGLPVLVKKSAWSSDFCFRVERLQNDTAYGTAYKNGIEHKRKFGGEYSYRLDELFLVLETDAELTARKEKERQELLERQQQLVNEQELIAAKEESASELGKLNPSTLYRVSGTIQDKEFASSHLSLVKSKETIFAEEKANVERIVGVIKRIVKSLLARIQTPQKPDWFDRETGPKGTLSSQASEEYRNIIANNAKVEDEIDELQEAKNNPYFYHILLQFDDSDDPTDVFIGERMVHDDEKSDETVISWQSELGSLAYEKDKTDIRVLDGTHARLHFRREVLIKEGTLKEAIETYNRAKTAGAREEEMVYDAFLLKILEAKREEHELTNIIPSIQRNQYQIIKAPIRENLIVQGCAGCGKTMILLHRISYLMYNNKGYRDQDYLVLSPSAQFNRHIQPLLRDLRLTRVNVMSVPEYYVERLQAYDPVWNELSGDERLFSDNGIDKGFAEYFYSKEYANLLSQRVSLRIKALKENEQSINALAETKRELKDSNKDVSSIEREIDRLKRLRRISIFDDEFSDILPEGMKPGNRKRPVCRAELFATVLLHYMCYGAKRSFPMVFIDEGQDLSISEYELIRSLNKSSVFNVYGDLGQRVNNYGITSWDLLNSIGDFSRYRINENYRNTIQITEFVNDEFMMSMTALGLNGPEVDLCTESQLVHERIIAPRDRKAVVYKDPETIERFTIALSGYEVFSVSEIKGMEFETVFVIPNGMTDNELYVSYTRALNKLFMLDI